MLSDVDVFFARGEKYSHAEVKLLAYRTQPCLLVVESLANRFDDVVVLIPPHTQTNEHVPYTRYYYCNGAWRQLKNPVESTHS
jgi:hypothetical protein